MDDRALLQAYVGDGSEDAFRQLVDRHLGMVYSAALRMVHDTHLAEDVAQTAFCTLAQKAGTLDAGTVVAGWLYHATRHHALHAIRSEQRRRQREAQALAMETSESDPVWARILEQLDTAMARLTPEARDLLVLRYLEGRSLSEVGEQLGISTDAARMHVNRALEELRELLAKEEVVITSTVLAAALTSSTACAVPAGLAATVASTALASGTTIGTGATGGGFALAKFFRLKTAAVVTGVAAIAVTSVLVLSQRQAGRGVAANSVLVNTAPQVVFGSDTNTSAFASRGASPDVQQSSSVASDRDVELLGAPGGKQANAPREAVAQSKGRKAQPLVSQAKELLDAQKYKEARVLLEEAIQINPRHASAHLFLGDALAGLRLYDLALTNYTRVTELRPDLPQGWFHRSQIYQKLEYLTSAIRDCNRAIELSPDFWQAYLGRGRALFLQRMYDFAQEDFEQVLELKPDEAEVKSYLEKIEARRERPLLTLPAAKQAVEKEPDNAKAQYTLANLLWRLGRNEESLPHYARAIELDPLRSYAWRERGRAYDKLGRWREAISDYTEYLRIWPQNHIYVDYRGMAHFHSWELQPALSDLTRAIKMQPARAYYYVNRARILLNMNRPAEALGDCDKALALLPVRNHYARFYRARALDLLEQPRKAIEDLTLVISEDPRYDEAMETRAELYLKLGDTTNALADCQRSLELLPKYSDAPFRAVRQLVLQGRDELALEFFNQLSRPDSTPSDAFESRASVYASQKRWTNAIADYTEAIRRRPEVGRFYLHRGFNSLCLGRMEDGLADGLKGLNCQDLSPQERHYLVLLTSSTQRDLGKAGEATTLLQQAQISTTNDWPGPIIQCLRGELTAEELEARTRNHAELSEAKAYLGWADLVEGRVEIGSARLQWVVEHALRELFEYDIARQLLARRAGKATPLQEKRP